MYVQLFIFVLNTQVENIENLILRYLSAETSEQETQQMREWLQGNKENRQLFAQYKKLWLGSRVLAGYDADKLKRDRKKVDLKIRHIELQQRLDRANRWIRVLAYAASVTLLLGITTVIHMSQPKTSAQQGGVLVAGGEIEVPYGSKSLIRLPDGSKVWVNAGSKISYPADFGVTSRNVYLSGEAYFDVAKMEEVPFFVNTDVIRIKVYGTAFNVKAYSDEQLVETTLDHGAISIIRNDAPEREINVAPNQKITIRRNTQKSPVSSTSTTTKTTIQPLENLDVQEVKSTETITAWKDNRLVFEQEPLWSLAKQLERRYNVQFRFGNEKIKTIRFTAAIKEMPIDQVLEAISIISPIHYTIKGDVVTLTENRNFLQK